VTQKENRMIIANKEVLDDFPMKKLTTRKQYDEVKCRMVDFPCPLPSVSVPKWELMPTSSLTTHDVHA
jgi:hypothetical protein